MSETLVRAEPVPVPPPRTEVSSKALVALVLTCVGVSILPVVASIIGLIFASKAAKEIKQSNGWITGTPFVVAARMVGWLGIAFNAVLVAVVGMLFFFSAGLAAGFGPGWMLPEDLGTVTTSVDCESSAWFQSNAQAAASLLPGTEIHGSDAECDSLGGDISYDVVSAKPFSQLEQEFGQAAIANGWTPDSDSEGTYGKQVGDFKTYVWIVQYRDETSLIFESAYWYE